MSNYLKILKYRKFIKKNLNSTNIQKKYLLLCNFNGINGLGLKLLKLYFIKYNFSLNLYKFIIKKTNILKNKLTNLIYLKFKKFSSLINFIKLMQKLTIIPFFFSPLYIFNKYKNILFPITNLKINTLLNLNYKNLINIIIIKLIKNIIILILLKLIKKITKCQP